MFQISYQNNLKWLRVYQFLQFFGITSFWLLFLSQKGMTLLQIGLLESIFHTTSLLSEIPSGILADRFSYKTNLYLSQIASISSALLMLAGNGNFWVYALGMIIWAWAYNFDSGTSSAMLFESSKEAGCEDRYLSLTSLMSGLLEASRALGKVAAGLLMYGLLDVTYQIKIVLSLITIVAISLMKEPQQKLAGNNKPSFRQILQTVKTVFQSKPQLLSWMLLCQFTIVIIGMFGVYYQHQFPSLTPWQISSVMLMASGINIAAVWLASRLGKRWPSKSVFLALVAMAASLFLLPVFKHGIIFPLIFLLSDSLIAFFLPIFNNDLQHDLPSEVRATMLSVNGMLYSLSMALVFPATGFLMDWLGFSQAIITLGIFLAVIGGMLYVKKEKL